MLYVKRQHEVGNTMSSQFHTERHHPPSPMMGGYRLFRLFGFDVKLNLTWLLLALLITWTLAVGMFPFDYPGLSIRTYWWMGLSGAVGILFSIVFHELSHSLVARHYGLPIRGITLFIFGGVAEMEEEPVSPKVEFLMAVAGPLTSLVLAALIYQFEQMAITFDWSPAVIGVSHYLAMVNLIVAIFNLVPAFPLDGGRMLRAAIWHWNKNLRKATHIASQLGLGFGLALMILGGLAFLQGHFIGGMWWFLIGMFLRMAARASYQQVLVKETLSDKPVSQFMNRHPITVAPTTSIQHLLDEYVYQYHHKRFPVVEDSKLIGCITTEDIKTIPREQWAEKTVGDLSLPCARNNTISADTSAASLISEMTKPDGETRYMVVENDRLVGVVSLSDLREFIALKLELEPSRN